MADKKVVVSSRSIANAILTIRAQRVLLDQDLASLYDVETRAGAGGEAQCGALPGRLHVPTEQRLRSQSVISNQRGGRRHRPYVFTEQGVAMLSSVLHSRRAVRANIEIMRTFVRLRGVLSSHERLAPKVQSLERNHDSKFRVVFDAIRRLMVDEATPKRRIGFSRTE